MGRLRSGAPRVPVVPFGSLHTRVSLAFPQRRRFCWRSHEEPLCPGLLPRAALDAAARHLARRAGTCGPADRLALECLYRRQCER
jgi:hypothetical protein